MDIYLNHSGNSFSDRKRLDLAPIDDFSVVNAFDLLGNGTTCFVWSSPLPAAKPAQMRYLDLFRGQKPHLITKVTNNLGSETRIQYASSSKFYLEDKQSGNPWVTRLPFPVLCVESVETIDQFSGNRFVTRYSYHHGFFDGLEREFRGFARVDQWDTENFSSDPTKIDSVWTVPPVHTLTWFHTGAYIENKSISELLSQEYFAPSSEHSSQKFFNTLLDDTVLPVEVKDALQEREACRSLKGHILRAEVYAEDGSDNAHIPYSVKETNFTILATQPLQDGNMHGVYFAHPRETIAYEYERISDDPRIHHEMVLEVDAYGNVLKDLNIAYGRQPGKSPLTGREKQAQENHLIVYSEHDFTNALTGTAYRVPMACEARQYELRGLQFGNTGRFQFADFVSNSFSAIISLPELEFEDDHNIPSRRLMTKERQVYRKDDLSSLLPVGKLESMALPGAKYDLAFTPGLLKKVFTSASPSGTEILIPDLSVLAGPQNAGYVNLDNDGYWWKPSDRISYATDPTANPAQELSEGRMNFFVPKCFFSPFGDISLMTYDRYNMYPLRTQDAVGNVSTAVMDYRTLQPSMITDSNGNRAAAAFDALGMLVGTATLGKVSDNVGDSLDGFKADLTQDEMDQFLASPTSTATAAMLGNASTRVMYDLWRVKNSGSPVYTVGISRETHVNQPPPPGGLKFQVKFTYSDGFGRAMQVKDRTKPGPMADGGPVLNDLWIGTGWTTFNNKDKPVRKFEPFFDDTHHFKNDMKIGVSPTTLYDPTGRLVAVLRQDHAIEKTVITPWSQVLFDVNDNVALSDPRTDPDIGHFFASLPLGDYLPSWYDARVNGILGSDEQAAAKKTAVHANTPRVSYLDALGRTFLTVEDNGTEKLTNSMILDIMGNATATRDALQRLATTSTYNMCGDRLHFAAMDSGDEWSLVDVKGQLRVKWNNRKLRFRFDHDALRRPTKAWLSENNAAEIMTQEIVYGEQAPDAQQHNLRGTVWQIRDQAGVLTQSEFDFDGNLLKTTRQLASSYKETLDLSKPVALEDDIYTTSTKYDALGRPTFSTRPDNTTTFHVYNLSLHIDKTFVNIRGEFDPASDPTAWTSVVTDVQYNAKGQTILTTYGNGTTSMRTYDPLMFRLKRLQTSRQSGGALQDLKYTYDAFGNVSFVRDDTQQTVFFRNVQVDPSCDYVYDPTYRLISATGREHLGQTNGKKNAPIAPGPSDASRVNILSPGDGNAMGLYTETYQYDVVGNMLSMAHASSDPKNPDWTRRFSYNEPGLLEPGVTGNRLSYTQVGSLTETYKYEGSAGLTGNMTSMAHLPTMQWNFKEQLQATSKQRVTNGTTPETTYYVYDSKGDRVRKATESQGGAGAVRLIKERIYLKDNETFRKYNAANGNVDLERRTVHVDSEKERVMTVDHRTKGTDEGAERLMRYQVNNYLQSSCLELDQNGQLISYEEYYPFGTTSYQAVASQTEVPKRYRYTGKELDDENGLYYYGARYYASWLGRWTAIDPLTSAKNAYAFVTNNPIRLIDPDGKDELDPGPNYTPADPWETQKNSSALGALVHYVVLFQLQGRLASEMGVDSYIEHRTLPGGSARTPFTETTGEVDLTVVLPNISRPGTVSAELYDLKPDNPSDMRKGQQQVRHYSNFFPSELRDGTRVSDARVGGVLESFEKVNPDLFRPLVYENEFVKVKISIRLPSAAEGGEAAGKLRGMIVYKIEYEMKNKSLVLVPEAVILALLAEARKRQEEGKEDIQKPPPKHVDVPVGEPAWAKQPSHGSWAWLGVAGLAAGGILLIVVTGGAAIPFEAAAWASGGVAVAGGAVMMSRKPEPQM